MEIGKPGFTIHNQIHAHERIHSNRPHCFGGGCFALDKGALSGRHVLHRNVSKRERAKFDFVRPRHMKYANAERKDAAQMRFRMGFRMSRFPLFPLFGRHFDAER